MSVFSKRRQHVPGAPSDARRGRHSLKLPPCHGDSETAAGLQALFHSSVNRNRDEDGTNDKIGMVSAASIIGGNGLLR
jgi:hypothetical protein